MAEIILPPEENEETLQVPELTIDKPTKNSKVITIEFEAKTTSKVSIKNTNQQLYTTDTDAWLEFKETSLEDANGKYSAVFRNMDDGSIFQRTGDVENGIAYYKIPPQEISHAGTWRGQVVYTLSNGDTTTGEFNYDVKGHILEGGLLEKPIDELTPTGGSIEDVFISSPHLVKIDRWSDEYYDFLINNQGDGDNVSITSLGLVTSSWKLADPNTSYVPPTSSTSEAQIMVIRGLLRNYIASKDEKWRLKALELTTALLRYYYPYETIPSTIDEKWIPHWLVNVIKPFQSREYSLYGSATFTKGVATFSHEGLQEVISIRSTSTKPIYEWDKTPKYDGSLHAIESIEYNRDEGHATITLLDKSIKGKTHVAFVSNTGPMISVGEKIEGFPVWRPLDTGEIACAVDSLHWALDMWELWWEITGDTKYLPAIESTKEAMRIAMDVSNTEYFIKGKSTSEKVLTESVTSYSERTPRETHKNRSGVIEIDYPSSLGEGTIGAWVGDQRQFNYNEYIEAKIGSDRKAKVLFNLDEDNGYVESKRWRSDIWLNGNGLTKDKLELITLKPNDFYKTDGVLWGEAYEMPYLGQAIADPNSSVKWQQKFGKVYDKNKPFTQVNMVKSESGWAQYMIEIWDHQLPFDVSYRTNSNVMWSINDSKGVRHDHPLPKTGNKWRTVTLTKADFPGIATGGYQSMLIDSNDPSSSIDIEYVGKLEFFNKNYLTSIHFGYRDEPAVKLAVEYIKPAPSRAPLKYTPYIMPFDYHLINYEVSDLRSGVFTGYQAPWALQRGIFEDTTQALNTNLQFLEDAQRAYTAMTGFNGFFAPVYFWNYKDDYGNNEPDTFGMTLGKEDGVAGSTDIIWGGFQYRTIKDVARVIEKDPDNIKAKNILIKFAKAVDNYWGDTTTGFPTVFGKDSEPYTDQIDAHMVTNFLSALMYGMKSETLNDKEKELIDKLLKKTLTYLDHWHVELEEAPQDPLKGTWTSDLEIQEWYGFWGGEILNTLGQLRMLIK